MPTTSNFGWTTPADTDLVKDGALAIRTLGNGIDTSMAELKGGTTGQILSKTSNTDMDFTWINNDQGDITGVTAGTGLTGGGTSGAVTVSLDSPVAATLGGTAQTTYATGDLLYASGTNTLAKRTIGTSGQVLTVSGGVPTWATPASSTPSFVGVKCYKTSSQSIPNASWTTATFDAESFDTDGFHSTSTNTDRITIPSGKGGKYLVQWQTNWAANSSGGRNTRLLLNTVVAAQGNWTSAGTSTDSTIHTNTALLNLVATDYLQLQIGQSSGGSLNANSGEADGCTFSVIYLGA